jgi:hypothetical protein
MRSRELIPQQDLGDSLAVNHGDRDLATLVAAGLHRGLRELERHLRTEDLEGRQSLVTSHRG